MSRLEWGFTFEFLDQPTAGLEIKYWSHEGDLSIGGETYKGMNGAIGIQPPEESAGTEPMRLRAVLDASDTNIRRQLQRDIGPLRVRLRFLYVDRDAVSPAWTLTGKSFVGRLSSPEIRGEVYLIDIESLITDIDRGRPVVWSNDSQRARHPGDRGFEFLADYESKGVDTKWPNH